MGHEIRIGHTADYPTVQRVLYEAATWDKEDAPPLEIALQHPELTIYHEGWGKPGDTLVVAQVDGKIVGGGYARFFTEAVHGYGFVDEGTPELALAVWSTHRGMGIGRRLLERLHEVLRTLGVEAISLSVAETNPAVGLYEKSGYRTIDSDGGSIRMVKNLLP
jgi:GNAT superfamily N-acetyltransferase